MIHDGIKEKYPILWSHIEHYEDGRRWQNAVAKFIAERRPSIIVETGVNLGTSADRILRAINGTGAKLYSIDPGFKLLPKPEVEPMELHHPQWYPFRTTSLVGMPRVFHDTGPWDVFVHDSDHEVVCQTFEYELAWDLVKPGGYIMSDDYTWAQHHAWDKFTIRHNVEFHTMGSVAYIQKPITGSTPSIDFRWLLDRLSSAVTLANLAADEHGEPRYAV